MKIWMLHSIFPILSYWFQEQNLSAIRPLVLTTFKSAYMLGILLHVLYVNKLLYGYLELHIAIIIIFWLTDEGTNTERLSNYQNFTVQKSRGKIWTILSGSKLYCISRCVIYTIFSHFGY